MFLTPCTPCTQCQVEDVVQQPSHTTHTERERDTHTHTGAGTHHIHTCLSVLIYWDRKRIGIRHTGKNILAMML